jgi:hypothetical protein
MAPTRRRRIPRLLLLLSVVLVAAACGDATVDTVSPPTTNAPTTTLETSGPVTEIVGGGSSFGECGGLCVGELRISGTDVSLERRSWDRSIQVFASGTLSDDARARLDTMEAALAGTPLDEVYGCPDCADGGAAWVDLVPVRGAIRVTYEFGAAPDVLVDWEAFRQQVSDGLASCASDALVTVAVDCPTEAGDPADDPVRIVRGGFSFGMCAGYCRTEIEIDGVQVVLTRQAGFDTSDGDLPDQVVVGELTVAGRARLDSLESGLATQTLQETYGCPDCADGGSGWVVVRDASTELRSTFEYADPPEALVEVDDLLQQWIATLRGCGSDADITIAPGCITADDPA